MTAAPRTGRGFLWAVSDKRTWFVYAAISPILRVALRLSPLTLRRSKAVHSFAMRSVSLSVSNSVLACSARIRQSEDSGAEVMEETHFLDNQIVRWSNPHV